MRSALHRHEEAFCAAVLARLPPEAAASLDALLKDNARTGKPYREGSSIMMGVSLGPKNGTGAAGNIKVPKFVIVSMKSKKLGIDKMPAFVAGQKLVVNGNM